MPDGSYGDHFAIVIDGVDDAVRPHADAVVVGARKFAGPGWTRVLGQLADMRAQP